MITTNIIFLLIVAVLIFVLGYRLGMKRAYKECTDIINQMTEDIKLTVSEKRALQYFANGNEMINDSKPDADVIDVHEWRRRRYGINSKDER
jgi:hypothetical protein